MFKKSFLELSVVLIKLFARLDHLFCKYNLYVLLFLALSALLYVLFIFFVTFIESSHGQTNIENFFTTIKFTIAFILLVGSVVFVCLALFHSLEIVQKSIDFAKKFFSTKWGFGTHWNILKDE